MPRRERLQTARPVALRQGPHDWYRIENSKAGTATVHIFDEIGWFGVRAGDFAREVAALDVTDLQVRLSSPGGDVHDGFGIYEALRSHKARVTVRVDALAASIASVIAMAGDEIVVAPHAEFMVHDALTATIGNAEDLARVIEHLNRESDRIAAVYAARAGGTAEEWRSRMRSETWFSAEEAVAAGLADRVDEPERNEKPTQVAASWDLSIFNYSGRAQAPDPVITPAAEPEQAPDAPQPQFDAEAFVAAMKGAFQ